MFDHRVSKQDRDVSPSRVTTNSSPGNVRLVPGDPQLVAGQPLGHVVVLPAPAPVLVGEPVDQLEMSHAEGGDAAKQIFVGQFVLELVHGHRHVAGLVRAGVEITVVLG